MKDTELLTLITALHSPLVTLIIIHSLYTHTLMDTPVNISTWLDLPLLVVTALPVASLSSDYNSYTIMATNDDDDDITHQFIIHSSLHDHCCSTNGYQLFKHFTEILRYLQHNDN